MTDDLDLADYLLIAEELLGVPAETIAGWPGVGLAESALNAPAMGFAGVEFYPDLFDKAAVLCVRLAWNHPLPDGNKPRPPPEHRSSGEETAGTAGRSRPRKSRKPPRSDGET